MRTENPTKLQRRNPHQAPRCRTLLTFTNKTFSRDTPSPIKQDSPTHKGEKMNPIQIILIAIAATLATACASKHKAPERTPQSVDSKATAEVQSKSGSRATGTVTFEKTAEGTLMKVDIKGLKPGGTHGFHIHEYGDCSAADAGTAGSHYNPSQKPHGGMTGDMRHIGDLENLTADKKGIAKFEKTIPEGSLPVANLVGRAVVVHEKADDLKTQPSGDSGKRIACGVIGIAKVTSEAK